MRAEVHGLHVVEHEHVVLKERVVAVREVLHRTARAEPEAHAVHPRRRVSAAARKLKRDVHRVQPRKRTARVVDVHDPVAPQGRRGGPGEVLEVLREHGGVSVELALEVGVVGFFLRSAGHRCANAGLGLLGGELGCMLPLLLLLGEVLRGILDGGGDWITGPTSELQHHDAPHLHLRQHERGFFVFGLRRERVMPFHQIRRDVERTRELRARRQLRADGQVREPRRRCLHALREVTVAGEVEQVQ